MDDEEEAWFNDDDVDENRSLFEDEENLDNVPLPAVETSDIMGSNSLSQYPWKPMKLKRRSSEDDDEDMVASVFKPKDSSKVSMTAVFHSAAVIVLCGVKNGS